MKTTKTSIKQKLLSVLVVVTICLGLLPAGAVTITAATTDNTATYGDFIVTVESGSASLPTSGDYLKLAYGGTYEVSMATAGTTTDMYILVNGPSDSDTTITLNGVSINNSSRPALKLATNHYSDTSTSNDTGANQTVSIQLVGTNKLVSSDGAGIEKNLANYGYGDLRISGTGSLTATGGNGAAGIGSAYGYDTMNIYIGGGTVVATGSSVESDSDGIQVASGAGIGAGGCGNAENITISGGTVTATGGKAVATGEKSYSYSGAGIGGGGLGDGSGISIVGGTVKATAGNTSAYSYGYNYNGDGIGGGGNGSGSNISISGGIVSASAGEGDLYGGAGIGGGGNGDGSSISISGGTVKGNSIGGGHNGATGTITITGGSFQGSMGATPVNASGEKLYRLTATLQYITTSSTLVNAGDKYVMSMSATCDYNIYSMYTTGSGELFLWLPEGAEVTSFTLANGIYSNSGVTMGAEATTGTFTRFLGSSIETEVIGYPGARLIAFSGNSPWDSSTWETSGYSSFTYKVIFDADETTDDDGSGSMNLIEAVPDGYTWVGLYLLEADDDGNFPEVDLTSPSISSSFTETTFRWGTGLIYGGTAYQFTMPNTNVKIVAVIQKDGTSVIAPTVTTSSLSNGAVGNEYSETLTYTGDTATWSISSGSLPDGLTLNSSTGEISGTPTTAGTYSFTVKAENATGSDTETLSITVTETVTLNVSGLSGAIAELSKYTNTGSDDTVTLTITPNDDSSFATAPTVTATNATVGALSVDDSGIYTCTISGFTGNSVVTVSGSTGSPYNVVNVSDSYATTTGAGEYQEGDTVTIDAGTRKGYIFSHWSADSSDVSFANVNSTTTTFTMVNCEVTITANWISDGLPSGTSLGYASADSSKVDPYASKTAMALIGEGSTTVYAFVTNPSGAGYTNDEYDENENITSYGIYPTYRDINSDYDYIFAGWYSGSEPCDSVPTGTVMAKFVVADVLTVGIQYAYEDDTKTTMLLRLVTSVDTLDYKETGFKITITKNNISSTVTLGTEKVYDEITGDSGAYTTKYTASDFSSLSKYLNTVVLEGVPVSSDYTIAVYAYWVTADGTTVVSTLEESYSGKIIMGYSTLADIVSAAS